MRGGGAAVTVPETGVRVAGARITGELNLEGARCPRSLAFVFCRIEEAPLLRDAGIDNLFLGGSALPGLKADRLMTRGGVFLRDAKVTGEVRLLGAKLGGGLVCIGATLTAGKTGRALNADGLETGGSFFLKGARVTGEVRLLGAKLGGDLVCEGATLTAGKTGDALNADRARIEGALFLRPDHAGNKPVISGVLDLTGARIRAMVDRRDCWPKDLILNRCVYDGFGGRAPVDAESRIDWLGRQDPARWGDDFWPQPWEQCAKVLREMGHADDARRLLIEKERRQRAARRARLRKELLFEDAYWHGYWDRVLGATVRYGRQPLLAFVWLFGFWLLGAAVFAIAFAQGAMKPNNAFILRSVEWAGCAGPAAAPHGSQLACFRAQAEARSYPAFNPYIYSIDTLLPVVDLEVQEHWLPDAAAPSAMGRWARWYLWLQILAGWALSLLAVAGFSGLVRSD
jgi:hypothetical protein